jgi:two-component system alkaline phosphatase synthesis response regulator PhoP
MKDPSAEPAAGGGARAILIADDDRHLNQTIADALGMRGFDAIQVYRGEDVAGAVAERRPELIILDILLPGKNGYEICRELKASPELASIPIIMFTVKDQQSDRLIGLQSGAIDYVPKPFFIGSLINKIDYILSRDP